MRLQRRALIWLITTTVAYNHQYHYVIFNQERDMLGHRVEVVENVELRKMMREKEIPQARIFYNVFTKSSDDEERVRNIVEEQFALIDPTLHETNVTIISIGHEVPLTDASLGHATYHISHNHKEGDEYLTLHALWKYCQSNYLHKDAKVIYLHSKGSFHPSKANDKLRSFLTHGALSSECANLPDSCNVCSSRMSPLPHPHTPGKYIDA